MLDWRAILGTALVHGLAFGAWPATAFAPSTFCLCMLPGPDVPVTMAQPHPHRLMLFSAPIGGDDINVLTIGRSCSGERAVDAAPIMLGDPRLPASLRGRPFGACATIDRDGRVTALRIRTAGERTKSEQRRIRRHIEAIRFFPAMTGEQPVATEIEVRLVG